MKKTSIIILLLIASLALIALVWQLNEDIDFTQQKNTIANLSNTEMDFGDVALNTEAEKILYVKNIGERPLIIYNIETSCGCTSVEWNKKPIKVGKSLEIKIKYKDKYPGPFIKTVSVYGNIEKVLTCTVKGNVTE